MTDSLVSREKGFRPSKGTEEQRVENRGEEANIDPSSALLRIETPEVQTFVRTLLEKSILSLRPVMSFERGATYPEASQIFGGRKSEAEIESFLLELSSLGLLDKQIVDRIIVCPKCKGTRVFSKYQCPRCHSFDVTTMQIIEHLLCGYIGPKTSLKGDEICPQCKQKIVSEKDYRSLGKTFGCLNCQHRFENPPVVHRCEDCENVFTYNQANYFPVYEFNVSSKTKEEFSSGLLSLRPVIAWLQEQGYRVESPKEVIGVSGSKHRFDIVGHTGSLKNVLLGDFAFAPSDQVIIATFAKKYDVNPSAKSFVVTYTQAPKNIDAVSKIYAISIIYIGEGKTPIEEQLRRMLAGTPQVIAASRMVAPSTFYLGPVRKDDKDLGVVGRQKLAEKLVQKSSSDRSTYDGGPMKGSRSQVAAGPVAEQIESQAPNSLKEDLSYSQRPFVRNRRQRTALRRKKSGKTAEEDEDDYYFQNDSASLDSSEDFVDEDPFLEY